MLTELLHFMIRHFWLSLALVLTLILLFWEESKNKTGGFRLSLPDATNLLNRAHAVLVDVRDTEAFGHGHIANAINLPQTDLTHSLEKLKKYQNKPIILVDHDGRQTTLLAHKLLKQGFSKTYCLVGGLQTWLNAGLPLTTLNHKK